MLHNAASMLRKEHQRYSHALQAAKVMASEHPSVRTLLGSLDADILKVAEHIYREECAVVPGMLPCRQQDECMRELHKELAGLQGKSGLLRPTARGRRCSHGHSISWACSPSAGPQGQSWPSD